MREIPKAIPPLGQRTTIAFEEFTQSLGVRLREDNKWVTRAGLIPWNDLEIRNATVVARPGRRPIPFRMALGALIVKAHLELTDRATLAAIAENPYIQFFLGLPSFSAVEPFNCSSITHFRKRISAPVFRTAMEIVDISVRRSTAQPTQDTSCKLFSSLAASSDNSVASKASKLAPPRTAREFSTRKKTVILISDEFWAKIEPLLPNKKRAPDKIYKRSQGAGRKPISKRTVFAAIIHVARTGIQWKTLPKSAFGASSAIHAHFQEWLTSGFFERLWAAGLAEYKEMEGVPWGWRDIDSPHSAEEQINLNERPHFQQRLWTPLFRHRMRSSAK